MQNTQVEVRDNILTITIDLDVAGEPSRSQKSIVIAKTEGFQPIAEAPEYALNLNVIKKHNGTWRKVQGIA